MSTPIQPVPDVVLASEFPSLADRPAGTYNAKAKAWADSENAMAQRVREIAVTAHNNAIAAEEQAQAAALATGGAEDAKEAAEAARDKAQEWAESPTAPEPGSKSAKTWAEEAEIYKDSAEAAAAAAGMGAGLPEPLEPGKVLGAISPTAVGWVAGLAEGYAEITTSQSWPVPPEATWVYVELIGGGASGGASIGGSGNAGRATGGGGGAFVDGLFRAADLPSSVDIIIGSGGSGVTANLSTGSLSGNDGGDSKFGSLLTARGGTRGAPAQEYSTVYPSGGSIGVPTTGVGTVNFALSGPTSGSGGVPLNGGSSDGGNAARGGAGGGGVNGSASVGSGGVSDNGGNGGYAAFSTSETISAVATNGQAPGGGGGAAAASVAPIGAFYRRSGSGGKGRARIYWW